MILLDTSVMIASLTALRPLLPVLERRISGGERLIVPAIVLYEWWRGPRLEHELETQQILFPSESAMPFGAQEAAVAAKIYRQVSRARSREIDLAIAACAIVRDAALWTLNSGDFKDIPGLRLAKPA